MKNSASILSGFCNLECNVSCLNTRQRSPSHLFFLFAYDASLSLFSFNVFPHLFCLSQSPVFQAQKDFNSLCACSVSLVLAPSFVTACTVVSLYYHNSQHDCSQRYRCQLDCSQLQCTQPYPTQHDPQTLGYVVQ